MAGRKPSPREPTMRDVAAVAGVSIKTVSRVVNGETQVTRVLVDRVLDAIGKLDYRPDFAASSLRRADRKTATIGLLLEDAANPFSSALHRAIEDAARGRDILVFAGSTDEDPDRERVVLRAFTNRRVDGLVIVPASRDYTFLNDERKRGTPMVFVDRPATLSDADSVTVDNRQGAQGAVRHLVAHGHRRIAFLGDLRSIWTATERHLGFIEGLAAEGVAADPHLTRHDLRGIDAAERATRALLTGDQPPSALFTAQNYVTIGAIRALQRLGLEHQIALVGFDDFELADLLSPGVSVVAQDAVALGRTAAELLFARLGGDNAPPKHIVLPTTEVIVRGSGEIRATAR